MGSIFLGVLLLSFLPMLDALNESMLDYLSIVWWAVLLGLVLGGIIDYFVPDGFIIRFLGQRRKLTLVYSVLAAYSLGLVASACSRVGSSVSCQSSNRS